jgi:hypothetical protein
MEAELASEVLFFSCMLHDSGQNAKKKSVSESHSPSLKRYGIEV